MELVSGELEGGRLLAFRRDGKELASGLMVKVSFIEERFPMKVRFRWFYVSSPLTFVPY